MEGPDQAPEAAAPDPGPADAGGPDRPTRTARPTAPGRGRQKRRKRLRVPGWSVPLIVLAALLVAELGARVVGPNIPRVAGSEERAYVKADQLFARSGPTSVVVLGSSETAGGIVPSVVSKEAPRVRGVYNAALAGTFLDIYRDWAEDVVIPAAHPKVVVISMLPMTVSDVDTRTKNYQQARRAYRSAFDQIAGGPLDLTWRARQRSALIRYRPYLRQPTLLLRGIGRTLTGTDDPTPTPGDMNWEQEPDPEVVKVNTGPDGEVYDYSKRSLPVTSDPGGAFIYRQFAKGRLDLAKLDRFVAELRAKGIEPVIFVPPVDRGPLEQGGADLSVLDGWTRSLVAWADAHDVPIHEEFTKDWSSDLFHDRNHVDTAGAQALSKVLGRFLATLCDQGKLGDACTAAR